MGNTHAFVHRIPAIFAASLGCCALALLALSGITCDFLEIRAKDGHLLYIPNSSEAPKDTVTYLGVICGSDMYSDVLSDSLMFLLARVCLFAAIAMGSFTCVLACAISSFVTPTEANWKLLSVFAAVAAVIQMPVFLLFGKISFLCDAQSCVAGCLTFLAFIRFPAWKKLSRVLFDQNKTASSPTEVFISL